MVKNIFFVLDICFSIGATQLVYILNMVLSGSEYESFCHEVSEPHHWTTSRKCILFVWQVLVERRIYPALLIITLLSTLIIMQVVQFTRLYEHIKNDKYLVGRRLVNYDHTSTQTSSPRLESEITPFVRWRWREEEVDALSMPVSGSYIFCLGVVPDASEEQEEEKLRRRKKWSSGLIV